MSSIFTNYVRSLEPNREVNARSFAVLWSTLRGALLAEMKKRSLMRVSPSYFGVLGYTHWSQDGAFDELVSDCYTFIFLERLPALQAQLRIKDNIEGLVFRNIRNFLHDTQKKNDPLGYRTYEVLRSAVRSLVDAGALHIAAGDRRLKGSTVLSFPAASREETAPAALLQVPVREWCDRLAPSIITARGAKKAALVKELADLIAGLSSLGISAFLWKDLVTAFKGTVRIRWNLLGAQLEGETALEKLGDEPARRVRVIAPDTTVEERDAYAKLCAHVGRRIDRSRAGRRRDLHRVWRYLRRYASSRGPSKIPARREIGRSLGLSRHQLAGHLAVLERWVKRFRRQVGR